MKITQETICDAIHLAWVVAHGEIPGTANWYSFWRDVRLELDGMWFLLHFSDGDKELMEDIRLLVKICTINGQAQ